MNYLGNHIYKFEMHCRRGNPLFETGELGSFFTVNLLRADSDKTLPETGLCVWER